MHGFWEPTPFMQMHTPLAWWSRMALQAENNSAKWSGSWVWGRNRPRSVVHTLFPRDSCYERIGKLFELDHTTRTTHLCLLMSFERCDLLVCLTKAYSKKIDNVVSWRLIKRKTFMQDRYGEVKSQHVSSLYVLCVYMILPSSIALSTA